jgi:hypothetical protein
LAPSFKRRQQLIGSVQLSDDNDAENAAVITHVRADGAAVARDRKPNEIRVVPLLDSNGNVDLEQAAVSALLNDADNGPAVRDETAPVVVPMLLRGRIDGIEDMRDDDEKVCFHIDFHIVCIDDSCIILCVKEFFLCGFFFRIFPLQKRKEFLLFLVVHSFITLINVLLIYIV